MTKFNTVITACPICKEELHVTRLSCTHCKTEITGDFSFSKFNYIDQEKLYFIEIFVKNRGNIKAVEKELNISYPTVKKMLDETIVQLGYSLEEEPIIPDATTIVIDHKKIIDQIEAGTISVKEAIEKLKNIKEKK